MMFGRNRPTRAPTHPPASRYVSLSTLPTPPASCDYMAAALPNLTNVDGNDVLRDCTAAHYAHQIGIWTGNAGTLFCPTLNQVVAFYSASSGYDPANPLSDQGADELTVLETAQTVGLAGHKILGACSVDPTDPAMVAACVWLFGGLALCAELPDEWVNPIPTAPGFTWDVAGAPNPKQGHCAGIAGYDADGLYLVTWGLVSEVTISRVTWPALAKYGAGSANGSLNAMLSQDWLDAAGKAPNGYDMSQLVADFQAAGPEVGKT
jgi:hypothetical protein